MHSTNQKGPQVNKGFSPINTNGPEKISSGALTASIGMHILSLLHSNTKLNDSGWRSSLSHQGIH